ncbi:hypothetical protein [Kitasatospora sp. NPDC127116]
MALSRPPRPFLDIRIGGTRLTMQRCPRRLLILVGSAAGALSGVLALHR